MTEETSKSNAYRCGSKTWRVLKQPRFYILMCEVENETRMYVKDKRYNVPLSAET